MLASLVSSAAGIALVLVVTNLFPRTASGVLFAATALFLVLVSACGLGIDVGLARFVPRFLVSGRHGAAKRILGVAVRPAAAAAVAVAVGLAVAAPTVAGWLVDQDTEGAVDDLATALRVLAVALPVAVLYEATVAATRAHGRIGPTILVERLGRSVVQVAAIVVVHLLDGGAVALTVAWVLPYVGGLAVAVAWLARIRRPLAGAGIDPDDAGHAAEFWRFTRPRAIGQVLQVALQRIDIVLVAATLGVVEAAVYTAATRFLVFGQIGTQAVQQVLQPQLSALLAADDLAGTQRLFRTATAWIMALAWPIYLSFAVLAPLAIDAFGDGYGDGEATVVILCLTMLFATAAGPVDVVLLMSGRSGASTVNGAVALAVDIGLVLALTPSLGITGAAVAWAAALVVRNVLPLVQVRRDLGLTSGGPEAVTVAAVVAVPFAAVAPFARWSLDADRPAVAAALTAVALVAVAAGLWVTRARTGVDALVDALRLNRPSPTSDETAMPSLARR